MQYPLEAISRTGSRTLLLKRPQVHGGEGGIISSTINDVTWFELSAGSFTREQSNVNEFFTDSVENS
jgi:hypothetical protein